MASKKRVFRAAAYAALALALLTALVVVLAPRLLDSRAVADAIESELSGRAGGRFTFERVGLALFPLPRVTFFSPRFSRTKAVSVRADRVVFYPHILPLLAGRIEIARMRIVAPAAVLSPGGSAEDKTAPFTLDGAAASLASAAGWIKSRVPDLSAAVVDGAIVLNRGKGPPLRFDRIEAILSTADSRLEINCRSTLWEHLQLQWTFDEKRPPGSARITVSQLRPERFANALMPESGPKLKTARVDLSIEMHPAKGGFPALSFTGELPEAVFERGKEQVAVSAASFAGSLRAEKGRMQLVVDRWKGTKPGLGLSARFDLGLGNGAGPFLERIAVRGSDIDVAEVKAPVLFFAGGAGDLEAVFDVLRAGRVEGLLLEARIPGAKEAFSPQDFHLKGHIEQGAVRIPGVDLSLTSVSGDAEIRGGVLTGQDLKARCQGVSGSGGALTLSLFDGSDRFGLDIRVDGALSGLPGTLKRLVETPSFSKGAETIRSLEGTASGRLVLGDTLDDLRVRADLDRMSATAVFSFLPKPVEISGKNLSYGGTSVSIGSLDLKTGGASATGIAGSLRWAGETTIEAKAASAEIRVDPVMSWLPETRFWAGRLAGWNLSGGTIRFSAAGLNGPLLDPARWDFDAAGDLQSVTFQSEKLPAPLAVSRLSFEASPETFQAKDFSADFMDASLAGSATIKGAPAAVKEARFSLGGKVGPEADRWLLKRFKAPEELALRVHRVSNLAVHWKRKAGLDLSGGIDLDAGIHLSASAAIAPDRLDIKRLSIQDDVSKAEISFQKTASAAAFSYEGRLSRKTVDRLVKDNRFLKGSVMGGFRGQIDLDSPGRSRVEGRLEVKDLALPPVVGIKVRIMRASLFGEGVRLGVEKLDAALDGDTCRLSGALSGKQDAIGIDLALSAERIDLDRWRKVWEENGPEKSGNGVPVTGTLDVDAGTILYKGHRFDGVSGQVGLYPDRTEARLDRGTLCGIAVPGTVVLRPGSMSLELRPAATGGRLSESAPCLLKENGRLEGRFSLNGNIAGSGEPDKIASALKGEINFSAQDGLIRENAGYGVLQTVLSLVNVTEIFAGTIPDFSHSGIRYNSITARSGIEGGVMTIREMVIDAKTFTLAAQGSVNLADRSLDITALVAPLKTVDRIVGKIPLVNDILNGTLVSIPVKVRGTLEKPRATFLPAGSVGKGLLGIAERALKLPFKIIRPGASNGAR